MEIEIYSDVVCPWCYIGKRRIEEAIAAFDGDVTVRYRPFQLDPSPVTTPEPLVEVMARRFGGPERAKQIFARTRRTGDEAGVELNFDGAVTANTFDAHRLIWFADRHGRQAEMVEALHRAHFTDGVDLNSRVALTGVAASAGLDGAEAAAFLASGDGVDAVTAALAEAHELGVTSVPTFVFAGKYAVQGAQDPQTLLTVLEEVRRRAAADAGEAVPTA